MKINKINFIICFLFFIAESCGKKIDSPPIDNNIAFPGFITPINSNHFLLLNTNANDDYKQGSIQQYSVDANGNHSFLNSTPVPSHGTELAVSPDSQLVALSFDSSLSSTNLSFYKYNNSSTKFDELSSLTLKFNAAGGKQSIKRLGFFTPIGGGAYYYLYGTIYSFPQDDNNSYENVPHRVFVAKIAKDFSTSSIMFVLSYGLNDPSSLASKSDSIEPSQYSFGSTAPTFDSAHNLLIAFPTGSSGGLKNISDIYPPLPTAFSYFNGDQNANTVTCATGETTCTQPDFRIVSLFAVDFTAILNNEPLNNSVYFAPLAWDQNGIPFGTGVTSDFDSSTFTFQSRFWDSYWMNTPHLGTGSSNNQCYSSSSSTVASNEYNLSAVGSNGLLVSKMGLNANTSFSSSNDVFQITGLDILSNSINTIKMLRGTYNSAGESNFQAISSTQILDAYNTYYTNIKSSWLNGKGSPIIPYVYSRTDRVGDFYGLTNTVAFNFGVLNFGSNSCLPYWLRDSYLGISNWGMDSAWLNSNNILSSSTSTLAPYQSSSVIDPTKSRVFSFPYASGAQMCTALSPTTNAPIVFCSNFLTGSITHFNTTISGTVFSAFE